MKSEPRNLWTKVPGEYTEMPTITAYFPEKKLSDAAVVIFPGGGYRIRAEHEGKGYAEFLAQNGYTAFVVEYRVWPQEFPLPLLDARRAVRWVRYHAKEYGIAKDKIAVMGSSAGAHLAALVSTYYDRIEGEETDEIDREEFLPNAQILCYPVISMQDDGISHAGSIENFLGNRKEALAAAVSPDLLVSEITPKAFVWHTFSDPGVNVMNSLNYVKSLKTAGVEAELHIFPQGAHGLGLADGEDKVSKHVAQWSGLLLKWLAFIGF
ncbi:MAG: alpha/beta hydrolase [Lachnospiraceae bacterium]|nr:alpha/beta hydrolase [Lachnospiraceae bacterium]